MLLVQGAEGTLEKRSAPIGKFMSSLRPQGYQRERFDAVPAVFTHEIAGCTGSWTMAGFREAQIARIRAQVGDGRVICGLSGGVDSAVAARRERSTKTERWSLAIKPNSGQWITSLLATNETLAAADMMRMSKYPE